MRIDCCKHDGHGHHQVMLSEELLFFIKAEMEALAGSGASDRQRRLASDLATRCAGHLKHWASLEVIRQSGAESITASDTQRRRQHEVSNRSPARR